VSKRIINPRYGSDINLQNINALLLGYYKPQAVISSRKLNQNVAQESKPNFKNNMTSPLCSTHSLAGYLSVQWQEGLVLGQSKAWSLIGP